MPANGMNILKTKRSLIEKLADSPTALICNAYSFLGLHAPCADWTVRCMTPELPAMVGEAITIKLDCSTPNGEHRYEMESSSEGGNALYYEMAERMAATDVPKIVVIQSLGEKSRSAVLGDGMAKLFRSVGASGFVTDGGVRDLADVRKAGLTTFGGGAVANHFAHRWSDLGGEVTVGGLTIKTGDIVHGDRDGLIVVPEAGWGQVVRACRHVLDFEKAAHTVLRSTTVAPGRKRAAVGRLADEYGAMMREIPGSGED